VGSLILLALLLPAPVLPPFLAFRYVFAGRPGRAWMMPLAVAGVGIGAMFLTDIGTVSAQSRFFKNIFLLLYFGAAAALTVFACLLGHAARLVAAARAPKGEG
jgi:hypothetical protein